MVTIKRDIYSSNADAYIVAFAGYASVFNTVDHQYDLVLPGAFRESIGVLQGEGTMLLWQHNPHHVVGTVVTLQENDFGLYIAGEIMVHDDRTQHFASMITNHVVSGLSIGYHVASAFIDVDTKIRYLEKVDLIEISIVDYPANSLARITFVGTQNDYDMKNLAGEIARSICLLQPAARL